MELIRLCGSLAETDLPNLAGPVDVSPQATISSHPTITLTSPSLTLRVVMLTPHRRPRRRGNRMHRRCLALQQRPDAGTGLIDERR